MEQQPHGTEDRQSPEREGEDENTALENEMLMAAIQASQRECSNSHFEDEDDMLRAAIEASNRDQMESLRDENVETEPLTMVNTAEGVVIRTNRPRVPFIEPSPEGSMGGGLESLGDEKEDEEPSSMLAAVEHADIRTVHHRRMPRRMPVAANEDEAELARVLALSVKTAEEEKRLRGDLDVNLDDDDDVEAITRQELTDETFNRNGDSSSGESVGQIKIEGLSEAEHEEARMIEAAMFGLPYSHPSLSSSRTEVFPSEFEDPSERDERTFRSRWAPPVAPSAQVLEQRLLREQQDDEFIAALAADKERELKAAEEKSERERQKKEEEERREKEEEERKRQRIEVEEKLKAKRKEMAPEPELSEGAEVLTVLVRLPDGGRKSRRFRKSEAFQRLFDFLDLEGGITPGSYKLVQMFPRKAFSSDSEESKRSFRDLGLNSKQEALVMEPLKDF